MEKVVYWIGVYSICVFTHNVLLESARSLRKQLDKKTKDSNNGRREIGNEETDENKPVGKIGFVIN